MRTIILRVVRGSDMAYLPSRKAAAMLGLHPMVGAFRRRTASTILHYCIVRWCRCLWFDASAEFPCGVITGAASSAWCPAATQHPPILANQLGTFCTPCTEIEFTAMAGGLTADFSVAGLISSRAERNASLAIVLDIVDDSIPDQIGPGTHRVAGRTERRVQLWFDQSE